MFHLHIQAWLWSVFCKAGNKVFIKKSFSIFFSDCPHIFVDLWCQGSLWWSIVSIRHCLTTQIAQRNTYPNSQVFTTTKVMIVEIVFKKNSTMSFHHKRSFPYTASARHISSTAIMFAIITQKYLPVHTQKVKSTYQQVPLFDKKYSDFLYTSTDSVTYSLKPIIYSINFILCGSRVQKENSKAFSETKKAIYALLTARLVSMEISQCPMLLIPLSSFCSALSKENPGRCKNMQKGRVGIWEFIICPFVNWTPPLQMSDPAHDNRIPPVRSVNIQANLIFIHPSSLPS